MITREFGVGTFPDVCWHDGAWWTAHDEGEHLILHALSVGGNVQQRRVFPLGASIGLPFPRLWSNGQTLWLAYRESRSEERIIVHNVSANTVTTLTTAVGNCPVAMGHGLVAWQDRATQRIFCQSLQALSDPPVQLGGMCPMGLARVQADGTVVTMDEDNFVQTGMTRPCFAGTYVVGEQATAPDTWQTRWVAVDTARLVGFQFDDGRLAKTPRGAVAPDGTLAVVVWGDHQPVRLFLLQPSELTVHDAVIPDPEPNRERDVLGYLVGDPTSYPHEAADGAWWDLKTNSQQKLLTFMLDPNQPHHTQVLRYDNVWIYLHWDGHVGQNSNGYTFTDGRWLRRMMTVGERVECPDNWLRRLTLSGKEVDRHPMAYTVVLVGRYLAYPCGALGLRPAIEFHYLLGDNFRERNLYVQGWGLYRWWAERRRGDTWEQVLGGLPIDRLGDPMRRIEPMPPPLPTTIYPVVRSSPRIEVEGMFPRTLTGRGREPIIEWRDRNNPGDTAQVWLDNGSVHVSVTTVLGGDTTGIRRPIQLRGGTV